MFSLPELLKLHLKTLLFKGAKQDILVRQTHIGSVEVFKKKCSSGIATPKPDMELIKKWLKNAIELENNKKKLIIMIIRTKEEK